STAEEHPGGHTCGPESHARVDQVGHDGGRQPGEAVEENLLQGPYDDHHGDAQTEPGGTLEQGALGAVPASFRQQGESDDPTEQGAGDQEQSDECGPGRVLG